MFLKIVSKYCTQKWFDDNMQFKKQKMKKKKEKKKEKENEDFGCRIRPEFYSHVHDNYISTTSSNCALHCNIKI
jgi:hypothetical protein